MPWAKVDDRLAFHPKTLEAGNEAMGLWWRALSYAAGNLSNGFISNKSVAAMGGSNLAQELVNADLWEAVEGGYQFKNWCEYQPDANEYKSKQEQIKQKRSAAGSKGMAKRWESDNKTDNKPITNAITNALQTDNPEPEPEPDVKLRAIEVNTAQAEPAPKRKTIPSPEGFEEFWATYPAPKDKGRARTAFKSAIKKVSLEVILDGARRYATDPNRIDEFTKLPATWLNAEAWDNDPLPARTQPVTFGKMKKQEQDQALNDFLNATTPNQQKELGWSEL